MSSWPDLVEAARALAGGPRRVLGITGPPGAGKSVLAEALVGALGGSAELVCMDGFHLRNAELIRLGRLDRKGAPDTFDTVGYITLLRRLRVASEPVVLAPRFDRSIEEPVADAVLVPKSVPLVVTEGNYLLADGPWREVRDLLDECWYVEVGEAERLGRLTARHEAYGRSADEARRRAHGSDLTNADVVASTRARATRIITVPPLETSSLT